MVDVWIPENLDLTNCDREPIHIPGSIQPHGVLFVLDPVTFHIIQCSENTYNHLSKPPSELLGQPISILIGNDRLQQLQQAVKDGSFQVFNTNSIRIRKDQAENRYSFYAHKAPDGRLLFELEFANDAIAVPFQYTLQEMLTQIETTTSVVALCQKITDALRSFTGFDRVMTYCFDQDWNGEVIAEAHAPGLESYFGLHYPASDIPQQARKLYLLNPIRIISDVGYTPVKLLSIDENSSPVDMSFASLRSVSPIHIEYLTNMGVGASMSISIIVEEKLWGLIACHHMSPKLLSQDRRIACSVLGRTLSLVIVEKERREWQRREVRSNQVLSQIFEVMTRQEDELIISGLISGQPNLLKLIPAHGVAVLFNGKIDTLGETPAAEDITRIATWLTRTRTENIYVTEQLAIEHPEFIDLKDTASGLIALTISRVQQEYILWFKPEEAKTVHWAGNPEKRAVESADGSMRLSPRQSFAAWQQVVKYKSTPWMPWEIEIAGRLRSLLIDTAIRIAGELKLRADILARLNRELESSNTELDSFAYVASHDLKEPLRGIHNYAVFLLEDYQSVLPEEGIEKITTLIRLSQRLEEFIDALLEYSRVGRLNLSVRETDLNTLVDETLLMLRPRLEASGTVIRIVDTLPVITCDAFRIAQVFTNLVTNAIKYNDKMEKWIEIGSQPNAPENYVTLYVRDNGIGIREKHFETIFRIFKRLHGRDSFGGGSGAGLTIAKKIVERHEGRLWVESQYGEGSTFFFTLKDLKDESL